MKLDRMLVAAGVGPMRVDRRLEMGPDNRRDFAVAIQPGERFRHQQERGRTSVPLGFGRRHPGNFRTKFSKHVSRLPQTRRRHIQEGAMLASRQTNASLDRPALGRPNQGLR